MIPLVEHFLEHLAGKRGERASFLDRRDPRVKERLIAYDWPGNIRELENVITKMVSLAGDIGAISFDMLPPEIRGDASDEVPPREVRDLQKVLDEVERDEIVNALRVTGGNRVRAAKLLGVNRRTLLRRLDKYGLQDNVVDDEDAALASDDFTSDDFASDD